MLNPQKKVPAQNKLINKTSIVITYIYSLTTKIAKFTEEYSIKNPDPNSASDSLTSKGIFFISVKIVIQKKMAVGKQTHKKQPLC